MAPIPPCGASDRDLGKLDGAERLHLSVRLLANRVLLELFVKVAAGGADDLGGLRDVPAVVAEFLHEKGALARFFEFFERARFGLRGRLFLGEADVVWKVGDVDVVARRHDEDALDGIAKLADVPGPAVLDQALHRWG